MLEHCNDCSVNCYVVRDNLDPVDGGIKGSSTNTSVADGGGLTLTFTTPDAATSADAGTFNPSNCILGTAPDHDCDGIPDQYDPYPYQKPFATANPTIFLSVAPGETGVGLVNLKFYLNAADVYFLVDQTGSMTDERNNLVAGLTTGTFITDPTYNCADYDFDGKPNNELKSQGLVGAIRCIIRDANLGVGYFRELPFSPTYATTDSIAFRNLQDITGSIPAVTSAAALLSTVGNYDWPEDDMVAMYSLVTGNGMYFGATRPGVPTRVGCPSATFGYPCFRSNAIPIVVMFTDAMMHNGPSNNSYPYTASYLGISAGTNNTYTTVNNTNETYASAYDLGDITGSFNSYIGQTTNMASDFGHAQVSCNSSSAPSAPDAAFKFTVSSTTNVSLNTLGSDFDTTLTLFRGAPGTAQVLPSYPNTNDSTATAYGFGNVTNAYVQANGSSSSLASHYSANDLSCGAAAGSHDATFTFSLSQATHVALDSSGSSYGTSVGLFSAAPPVAITTSAINNSNDTLATAYSVGSVNNQNLGFSGDTSASSITANYTAAQLNCGSSAAPADAAPDAVYNFSLSSPTRVRLSTESSALHTVIALTDNGANFISPVSVASTNEAQATAYAVGALDGRTLQYTGSTASMAADYSGSLVGCGAGDTSRDAVYQFTLNGTKTIEVDTLGSNYDTVLGLFTSGVTNGNTPVTISGHANETGLTAYNLGTVNATRYVVSGGSTSTMNADYSSTQIGCGGSSSAPDAVFKFHLASATRVRVDTLNSSYNTLISLHNGPLPDLISSTISPNNNEAVATALSVAPSTTTANLLFNGNTSAMTPDVPVNNGSGCAASTTGRDAVFRVNIPVTGNYELNTIGSSFDTILGLYPSTVYNPSPPTAVAEGTAGEQKTTAVNVGALDGQWLAYTGNTSTMANNMAFSSCSANAGSKDAFYKFTLNSARTVSIDTIGSAFDTVIGLYNYNTDSLIQCDNDSGGNKTSALVTSSPLAAGTYYVIIKSTSASGAGAYTITFRDTAVSAVTNLLYCDDNSGGGTTSKITASLAAGTYYAVVKGYSSTDKGSYSFAVKATDAINSANQIACNDDYNGTTQSLIEQNLTAGDYYVVVKGYKSSSSGSYMLTVQDITIPPVNGFVSCNDDYTGVTSQITQTLNAGTYYVVVKGYGAGSSSSGNYVLNLKDTSASIVSTYQCDYNSGASGTSLIETNLNAGNYRVIVKGKSATDKGAYNLLLRDLTQFPTNRLACDHNSGSTGASHVEADLAAGTYSAVMTGDTSAGSGAYSLSVRDATDISTTDNPVTCNNDASSSTRTSAISQSLTPGTYYALVKGYSTSDVGTYQLNLGGGATHSATYSPPTWSQTLAALQATQTRVISVISCHDDPLHGDVQGDCVSTRTQAQALANATGALGSNLQPLVFDINGDGTGLTSAVVNGVANLAHYLSLDVSVRVVFDPDPNPGFGLVVQAVPQPGDGCQGIVGTTHTGCVPGATPQFQVQFTNPSNQPVSLNPNDPKGGYNFRAELIGDNQFIIDKVPIYIIPRDVTTPPAVPQVAPMGTYWQDIGAPGCTGNDLPDWHDLSWTVDVPQGTSVSFNVCASDTSSALSSCPLIPLCTITGGGSCTVDTDCPNGFCSTTRQCQTVTAGTCLLDTDCSQGATCAAERCTFHSQPVYVGGVLGSTNYTNNLRVQIALVGNTVSNTSPTVHDWSLNYVCNAVQ